MRNFKAVTATILAGCVGSAYLFGPSPTSPAAGTFLGLPTIVPGEASLTSVFGHCIYADSNLTLHANRGDSPQKVTLEFNERDPGKTNNHQTGETEWIAEEYSYTTPYYVMGFAHRGGNEAWIAGVIPRNDDDVIERWIIPGAPGGWTASRPASGTPLGVSVGSASTTASVVGGQFIPPTARSPYSFPPVREEIWRGSIGGIRNMAVDPDGRFVLLLSQAGELLQLSLDGSSSGPMVLFTPTQFPMLAAANSLSIHESAGLGRLALLQAPGDLFFDYLLLKDASNDGLFEASEQLDQATWESLGYRTQERYEWDDFYFYM